MNGCIVYTNVNYFLSNFESSRSGKTIMISIQTHEIVDSCAKTQLLSISKATEVKQLDTHTKKIC